MNMKFRTGLLSLFLTIIFSQLSFASDEYNSEECGIQYTSDRIIGGTITNLDEFPWMGLIAYMSDGVVSVGCGGVLINHRYILTAAHCVKGTKAGQLGKIVAVRLGEYDLKSAIDCKSDEIEETCAPAPIDYFVEKVHSHPDYKPGTLDRHHDIALIRLNQTVKYTKYVRPICLPPSTNVKSSLLKAGEKLIVCGWGKTEKQESGSGIKLKADVPVVAKKGCKSIYSPKGVSVVDSQICAGGGTSDTCKGDSGGPLMAVEKSTTNDEKWYAVGVVSFGSEKCGSQGVPAIYTSTFSYLNWMNSVMKP